MDWSCLNDELCSRDQYDMLNQQLSAHKRLLGSTSGFVFFCLLVISIGVFFLCAPERIQSQTLAWQDQSGNQIKGSLYLPQDSKAQLPAVLLCHGVTQTRHSMSLMAKVLSQKGMAVLTVDLPGDQAKQEEIALAALQFLRSQSWVDAEEVAVIGYSMGAPLAEHVTQQAGQVAVSLGIGMQPENAFSQQIWLTGLYDSLHPPWSFPVGTLEHFSASANHHTEITDPYIHQAIVKVLQQHIDVDEQNMSESVPWGSYLRFWSLNLMAFSACGFLMCHWPFAVGSWRGLIAVSLVLVGLLGMGYFSLLPTRPTAYAVLVVLMAYYLSQGIQTFGFSKLVQFGSWGLLLWVCRELSAVLRTARLWLFDFGLLLNWPLALWQSLLFYPRAMADRLLDLCFQENLLRLEPSGILLGLLMLEWVFPCWYFKPIRWASQQWMADKKSLVNQNKKLKKIMVCGVFLLGLSVFFAVLSMRYQQGYLRLELIERLKPIMLGDILPTFLIFILSLKILKNKFQKSAPEMT